MSVTWTREAAEALGPTTDVPTAAQMLGISQDLAYQLIRTDSEDWPTRVLRLGRCIRIPTRDLIVLLFEPSSPVVASTERADAVPSGHETPGQSDQTAYSMRYQEHRKGA